MRYDFLARGDEHCTDQIKRERRKEVISIPGHQISPVRRQVGRLALPAPKKPCRKNAVGRRKTEEADGWPRDGARRVFRCRCRCRRATYHHTAYASTTPYRTDLHLCTYMRRQPYSEATQPMSPSRLDHCRMDGRM